MNTALSNPSAGATRYISSSELGQSYVVQIENMTTVVEATHWAILSVLLKWKEM
jgi:hypothetical protein